LRDKIALLEDIEYFMFYGAVTVLHKICTGYKRKRRWR
jgi:hypothetical protein